eukprot:6181565-Pleurochrysis_carterae.AAC.2
MRDSHEDGRPYLPALAKCALASSFLLALGIWFVVNDPVLPSPVVRSVGPAESEGAGIGLRSAGSAGSSSRGSLHAQHPHKVLTSDGLQQSRRRRPRSPLPREYLHATDRQKSEEVQNASSDPTSMFDMSTP